MENSYIFERTDHTLLSTKATKEEIIKLCNEAVKYNTASVCIPPAYIKFLVTLKIVLATAVPESFDVYAYSCTL